MNVRSRLARARRSGLCLLHYKILRRPKPTPFLVLTTSRSGSTWLCDLLTRALYIEEIREDYRPQHYQAFLAGELETRDLLEIARGLFDTQRLVPRAGSKLIWDTIPGIEQRISEAEKAQFLTIYSSVQPALIRLRRHDRVAQAVSRFVATQTRVFHRTRDQKPVTSGIQATAVDDTSSPQGPVGYDFDSLLRHYRPLVRAERHLDTLLSQWQVPVHTVVYEELVAQPEPVLAETLGFLARGNEELTRTVHLASRTPGSSKLVSTSSDINRDLATRFSHDLATRNLENI